MPFSTWPIIGSVRTASIKVAPSTGHWLPVSYSRLQMGQSFIAILGWYGWLIAPGAAKTGSIVGGGKPRWQGEEIQEKQVSEGDSSERGELAVERCARTLVFRNQERCAG